jgi:NAD-dependent SIR2 family protein deacetylase
VTLILNKPGRSQRDDSLAWGLESFTLNIYTTAYMSIATYLKNAAEIIHDSDALLITAGAGMGVDSGLPDFRGNQGFWKAYPPIAKLGISFVEMANPYWFQKDPYLAWAFYGHRLNLYRKTIPHDGFRLLLQIGQNKPAGYFVFTSNVDGQFQKAGFSDDLIEECHGSIHHLQCNGPCNSDIWSADSIQIKVDEDIFKASDPLPKCTHCQALARPNILMFGDWNWLPHRTESQQQRMTIWLETIRKKGWLLAIIELGAGEAVATVRYTSENIIRNYDGKLIRINPRDYLVPQGHVSIPLGAREGIQGILEHYQ